MSDTFGSTPGSGSSGSSGSTTYSFGAFPILNKGKSLAANDVGTVVFNLTQVYGASVARQLASQITGKSYKPNSTAWQSDLRNYLTNYGGGKGGIFAYQPPTSVGPGGGGGGGGGGSSAADAAALARQDRINALHDNSYATLQQQLSVWGLDSLTPWVHDQVFSSDNNINTAIIQNIRNTAEYKTRFSGMDKLKQNQPGATETTYMQLEDSIRQTLNGVNMPPGWLTQQQVGTLIGNGMYGANLNDRINKGLDVIQNASAQTKQMLNEYYGVDTGNLLGYVLDPNNNNYQQQIQASQAGGAALQAGFQGETKAMSEMLASSMPASTTSPQEFTAGFSKAAMLQPLEQTMAGQRGQATASSDQLAVNSFAQLGDMFNTDQGQVASTIKLAEQARVAGLSGGGGYVQDAGGGVGVGRTSTAGTGK